MPFGSGALTVIASQSSLEDWRYRHFGTTDDSGIAADTSDSNSDGESNLLEFATNQDPNARSLVSTPIKIVGTNIEFRYPRSKEALADGIIFTVEWSDSLENNTWSNADVVETTDPENPDTSDTEIENRLATLPIGVGVRRFARLKVIRP